jgi:hypothetical protein
MLLVGPVAPPCDTLTRKDESLANLRGAVVRTSERLDKVGRRVVESTADHDERKLDP